MKEVLRGEGGLSFGPRKERKEGKIEEMSSLELQTPDETQRQIKDRLLSGWFVVSGNNDCIEWLENQVYPPGTTLNEDFVLIIGPALARYPALIGFLFLAKTQRYWVSSAHFNEEQSRTSNTSWLSSCILTNARIQKL